MIRKMHDSSLFRFVVVCFTEDEKHQPEDQQDGEQDTEQPDERPTYSRYDCDSGEYWGPGFN